MTKLTAPGMLVVTDGGISVEELRDLLNTIERPEQLRAAVIVGGSDQNGAHGVELTKAYIDFEKGGPVLVLETVHLESGPASDS